MLSVTAPVKSPPGCSCAADVPAIRAPVRYRENRERSAIARGERPAAGPAGEVDVLLALRVHETGEKEGLHELVVDEDVHGGAAAAAVSLQTQIRIDDGSIGRHG